MSRENVEAVRGIYERWAIGDFRAGTELFDPLIVFVMRPEFPDAGVYVGPEEVAKYMRGFLEPWVRLTISAQELTEIDGTVLAAVHQQGTGTGSGAATEFHYFQAWSFRGGRVIRLETIRRRAQAMEALGLDE